MWHIYVLMSLASMIASEDIESLGCWRDINTKRALPSLENTHHILSDPYKKRSDPIIKCAQVANDRGFTIFGIQHGGQCFAGHNDDKSFSMYGPSNLCKGGKGGPWANDIYSTKTFHTRTVHTPSDPSPWDPYCNRDLDIVLLLDGSGSKNSKSNRRRWEDILNFAEKFVRGFDHHCRIGVVKYGGEPTVSIDIMKATKTEKLIEDIKVLEMAGGQRTLNDALKVAWREQLKETNRTYADKVVIAIVNGDIPYGLYGSSQFLSDHLVRVVAIGVDKEVHYEFLQSVASYRDVKNIFSVNREQLGDIAPYVYRDVCNTFPEYVSETTTTSTTPKPTPQTTSTPAPGRNSTATNATTADAPKEKEKASSSASNTKDSSDQNSSNSTTNSTATTGKSRGDIITIPLSALPFSLNGFKKDQLPQVKHKQATSGKKHLVTVLNRHIPKEQLATMVLVNPKPELNLDLTDTEVSEINGRGHTVDNTEEELVRLSDRLNEYKKFMDKNGIQGTVVNSGEGHGEEVHGVEAVKPYTVQNDQAKDNIRNQFYHKPVLNFVSASLPNGSFSTSPEEYYKPGSFIREGGVGNITPTESYFKEKAVEERLRQADEEYNTLKGHEKDIDSYLKSGSEKLSPTGLGIDGKRLNNGIGLGVESSEYITTGNNGISMKKIKKNDNKVNAFLGNITSNSKEKSDGINEGNKVDIAEKDAGTETNNKMVDKAGKEIKMVDEADKDEKGDKMVNEAGKGKEKEETTKKLEKNEGEKENKNKTENKKENKYQIENTKFKPKFIPETKSDVHDVHENNNTKENVTLHKSPSQIETGSKDLNHALLNKPGEISQTMEFHSGNGKEHVDYHPPYHAEHQKLFSGKLKDHLQSDGNSLSGHKLHREEKPIQRSSTEKPSTADEDRHKELRLKNLTGLIDDTEIQSGITGLVDYIPSQIGISAVKKDGLPNRLQVSKQSKPAASGASVFDLDDDGPMDNEETVQTFLNLNPNPLNSYETSSANVEERDEKLHLTKESTTVRATPKNIIPKQKQQKQQHKQTNKKKNNFSSLIGAVEKIAEDTAKRASNELKIYDQKSKLKAVGSSENKKKTGVKSASSSHNDLESKVDTLLNAIANEEKGGTSTSDLKRSKAVKSLEKKQLLDVFNTLNSMFDSQSFSNKKRNDVHKTTTVGVKKHDLKQQKQQQQQKQQSIIRSNVDKGTIAVGKYHLQQSQSKEDEADDTPITGKIKIDGQSIGLILETMNQHGHDVDSSPTAELDSRDKSHGSLSTQNPTLSLLKFHPIKVNSSSTARNKTNQVPLTIKSNNQHPLTSKSSNQHPSTLTSTNQKPSTSKSTNQIPLKLKSTKKMLSKEEKLIQELLSTYENHIEQISNRTNNHNAEQQKTQQKTKNETMKNLKPSVKVINPNKQNNVGNNNQRFNKFFQKGSEASQFSKTNASIASLKDASSNANAKNSRHFPVKSQNASHQPQQARSYKSNLAGWELPNQQTHQQSTTPYKVVTSTSRMVHPVVAASLPKKFSVGSLNNPGEPVLYAGALPTAVSMDDGKPIAHQEPYLSLNNEQKDHQIHEIHHPQHHFIKPNASSNVTTLTFPAVSPQEFRSAEDHLQEPIIINNGRIGAGSHLVNTEEAPMMNEGENGMISPMNLNLEHSPHSNYNPWPSTPFSPLYKHENDNHAIAAVTYTRGRPTINNIEYSSNRYNHPSMKASMNVEHITGTGLEQFEQRASNFFHPSPTTTQNFAYRQFIPYESFEFQDHHKDYEEASTSPIDPIEDPIEETQIGRAHFTPRPIAEGIYSAPIDNSVIHPGSEMVDLALEHGEPRPLPVLEPQPAIPGEEDSPLEQPPSSEAPHIDPYDTTVLSYPGQAHSDSGLAHSDAALSHPAAALLHSTHRLADPATGLANIGTSAVHIEASPKNPVVLVDGNHIVHHHDASVESPVKPTKDKFKHLNLNTLSRKNVQPHPPKHNFPTPKPPVIAQMSIPDLKPIGHGIRPIRPLKPMKQRALHKDTKAKDATRLVKHVRKKNELLVKFMQEEQAIARSKQIKAAIHLGNVRHTIQPAGVSQNFGLPSEKSAKVSKQNGAVVASTTSKQRSTVKMAEKETKGKVESTLRQVSKSKTSVTKANVIKHTIDFNKPLSMIAHGNSIHFKTPPEMSKRLINQIIAKKANINHVDSSYLKESDFPRSFTLSNFNIATLPPLKDRRSYVLTTLDANTVTVTIKDDIPYVTTSTKRTKPVNKTKNTNTASATYLQVTPSNSQDAPSNSEVKENSPSTNSKSSDSADSKAVSHSEDNFEKGEKSKEKKHQVKENKPDIEVEKTLIELNSEEKQGKTAEQKQKIEENDKLDMQTNQAQSGKNLKVKDADKMQQIKANDTKQIDTAKVKEELNLSAIKEILNPKKKTSMSEAEMNDEDLVTTYDADVLGEEILEEKSLIKKNSTHHRTASKHPKLHKKENAYSMVKALKETLVAKENPVAKDTTPKETPETKETPDTKEMVDAKETPTTKETPDTPTSKEMDEKHETPDTQEMSSGDGKAASSGEEKSVTSGDDKTISNGNGKNTTTDKIVQGESKNIAQSSLTAKETTKNATTLSSNKSASPNLKKAPLDYSGNQATSTIRPHVEQSSFNMFENSVEDTATLQHKNITPKVEVKQHSGATLEDVFGNNVNASTTKPVSKSKQTLLEEHEIKALQQNTTQESQSQQNQQQKHEINREDKGATLNKVNVTVNAANAFENSTEPSITERDEKTDQKNGTIVRIFAAEKMNSSLPSSSPNASLSMPIINPNNDTAYFLDTDKDAPEESKQSLVNNSIANNAFPATHEILKSLKNNTTTKKDGSEAAAAGGNKNATTSMSLITKDALKNKNLSIIDEMVKITPSQLLPSAVGQKNLTQLNKTTYVVDASANMNQHRGVGGGMFYFNNRPFTTNTTMGERFHGEDLLTDIGYTLGCDKPLRVLYAVDVSEGMGVGTSRQRRWNRLKQFIKNINSDVIKGVRSDVMVYNIEPRILQDMDACDKQTEYFLTADQCLCNKQYNIRSKARSGCTVNGPTTNENLDDWGKTGPRTGIALKEANKRYFDKDREKYKNVVLLLSHKRSQDDVESAEKELKNNGISLIDIELGQRHDLRRRTFIPSAVKRQEISPNEQLREQQLQQQQQHHLPQRNHIQHNQQQQQQQQQPIKTSRKMKRTSGEQSDALPKKPKNEQHRMKVSLKKLSDTLRSIISKVCKTKKNGGENMRKRSLDYSDFY